MTYNNSVDVSALRIIMKARGMSQSDLARLAGVSRQAVSLWFSSDEKPQPRSGHLENLSRGLGVSIDDLVWPLPFLENEEGRLRLGAELNWDKMYPDVEGFLLALCRDELKAVARLVEAYGLFASARMAGPAVLDRFPEYKRFLPPALRRDLEPLWKMRESLGGT